MSDVSSLSTPDSQSLSSNNDSKFDGEKLSLVIDRKENYAATPPNGDSTKRGSLTSQSETASSLSGRDSDDVIKTNDDECTSCCQCCTCSISLMYCKAFYFCFVGAMGCIHPYVSIYMKQLGLSPQQIGLIFGLRPMVGFCSAPLWGALGDMCRVRKLLLLISLLAWLGFFTGFFHIKPPTRLDSCPPDSMKPMRQVLPQRGLQIPDNFSHTTQTPAHVKLLGTNDSFTGFGDNDTLFIDTNSVQDSNSDMHEYIGWMFESESLWRVFITALALIVSGEIMQSPASALADAGTLQTMDDVGLGIDHYGSQRAWGSLGFGVSSFMAGALVSSSRQQETICGVELYFSDYRLLTYVFIGFLVLAFVAATQIKFKEGKDEEQLELTGRAKSIIPTPSPAKDHSARAVIRIFLNVHYGSWLATSFFVGICNGLIWGFLYWHLDNLGADQMLLGVAGTVLCLSEFVMFFLVGKIIKVFGHMGIMYLGLFGYTIRFCVYAVIKNPWWVLPAEMLQGVTFSCVWVSMTAYTTMAVPSGSLATVQGILHGVYFGLGSGSGHLIGGLMIGYFGAVITFFGFAAAAVVVLILFAVAQKCSVKPDLEFSYKDLDNETEAGTHTPAPETTGSTAAAPSEGTTRH